MKAIAVIGYHHTGKTTAVCAIISALKARGFSVSSIKDIHAQSYRADSEGSNSAKHAAAGSEAVWARGLQDNALVIPGRINLADMIAHLSSDYLIIEGMKDAPVPKIVCAETEAQLDELIDETTIGISGIISDRIESYRGLPVFCLARNPEAMIQTVLERSFPILPASEPDCCSACGKDCYAMAADIVQGRALRSACVQDSHQEMLLRVNGQEIAIVPFVQKLLKDSILSFVHNLKGVDKDGTIEIKIET